MKKVFALLLTVMMLAGISCAWAEGTTEEAVEITFQGITWGSSVEAVAEWVVQREEFTMDYNAEQLLSGYIPWSKGIHTKIILTEDGAILDVNMENNYQSVLASWGIFDFMLSGYAIAGYGMSEISYAFTYDGETTGLISVGVQLDCPNGPDAAFEDLQQKLRTVYGEGDVDNENIYFKKGANNTAVLLRKNKNPILIYGVTNAAELIDAMMAVETPAPTANPADTSGL